MPAAVRSLREISCVIADDHPAIVAAASEVLAARGIAVVGHARDGEEALELIAQHTPNVALVDLRMPGIDGLEVTRQAREQTPQTRVILYTAHADRALLTQALDVGAVGYVLKEAPLADLLRAIEVVARGDTYVDPGLASILTSTAAEQMPVLTPREREVLKLLADGLRNEEIGRRLHIASETARTHVRNAMSKLDADTRTQAVASAIRRSLIS